MCSRLQRVKERSTAVLTTRTHGNGPVQQPETTQSRYESAALLVSRVKTHQKTAHTRTHLHTCDRKHLTQQLETSGQTLPGHIFHDFSDFHKQNLTADRTEFM